MAYICVVLDSLSFCHISHFGVLCEEENLINISSRHHHAWNISNNKLLFSTRKYFLPFLSLCCASCHLLFVTISLPGYREERDRKVFIVESFSFGHVQLFITRATAESEEVMKSSGKKFFHFSLQQIFLFFCFIKTDRPCPRGHRKIRARHGNSFYGDKYDFNHEHINLVCRLCNVQYVAHNDNREKIHTCERNFVWIQPKLTLPLNVIWWKIWISNSNEDKAGQNVVRWDYMSMSKGWTESLSWLPKPRKIELHIILDPQHAFMCIITIWKLSSFESAHSELLTKSKKSFLTYFTFPSALLQLKNSFLQLKLLNNWNILNLSAETVAMCIM